MGDYFYKEFEELIAKRIAGKEFLGWLESSTVYKSTNKALIKAADETIVGTLEFETAKAGYLVGLADGIMLISKLQAPGLAQKGGTVKYEA